MNNISAARGQEYLAARETWLSRILADHKLPARAKVVATVLYFYFNRLQFDEDGTLQAWPGHRTLDAKTGLDRKTVAKGIKDLEGGGYVKIHHRGFNKELKRYDSDLYMALTPGGKTKWTGFPLAQVATLGGIPRGNFEPTLGDTGGGGVPRAQGRGGGSELCCPRQSGLYGRYSWDDVSGRLFRPRWRSDFPAQSGGAGMSKKGHYPGGHTMLNPRAERFRKAGKKQQRVGAWRKRIEARAAKNVARGLLPDGRPAPAPALEVEPRLRQ